MHDRYHLEGDKHTTTRTRGAAGVRHGAEARACVAHGTVAPLTAVRVMLAGVRWAVILRLEGNTIQGHRTDQSDHEHGIRSDGLGVHCVRRI
jgi:hypothetical protein